MASQTGGGSLLPAEWEVYSPAIVSKTLGAVDNSGKFNLTVICCLTWSMLQTLVFHEDMCLDCFKQPIMHTSDAAQVCILCSTVALV